MLIRLAEVLDTSVTVLLGETVETPENVPTDLKVLSEKLELLNEQFARHNEKRRKIWRVVFIAVGIVACAVLVGELIQFIFTQTAISSMDESIGIIGGADGPTQILVARTVNPISDWIFALIGIIAAGIGIYATRRK